MSKTDFTTDRRKLFELLGRIESLHGKVRQRRSQVLTDCQNVDACCVNLPHQFYQLIPGFAQPDRW